MNGLELPGVAGIYKLYLRLPSGDLKLVYIGQAENIRRRVRQHKKPFDEVTYEEIPDPEIRSQTEQVLINQYDPPYNKTHSDSTPLPADSTHPETGPNHIIGVEDTTYDQINPLEALTRLPDDIAHRQLSTNQNHTRFIATNVSEYLKNEGDQYTITSSDIRRAIKDRTGDDPHTQTVSRVITFLNELGKDHTRVTKSNGRRTVIISDELLTRLKETDEEGDAITPLLLPKIH